MNILIASSRQWHPEDEWIRAGIQNLISEVIEKEINWVIFDKNPDLLRKDGFRRRRVLHSNSFHHQSVIPFSMAIIAGSNTWHNPSLSIFFRLVAKSKIPLFALGLGLPEDSRALSKDEMHCFKRRSTVITSRDIATKNYFHQYGLDSIMLPCPSLFSAEADHATPNLGTERKPKIGFVVDDTQMKSALAHESFVRELCQFIEQCSDSYDLKVICPTVNEFMRFSPMFGERTLYSFEARDYTRFISNIDILVTNNLATAHLANAVGKISLFVSESAPNEMEFAQLPFIKPATLDSLTQKFQEIIGKTQLYEGIRIWKKKIREQWLHALPARNAPIGPAERHVS